jgi:hypothetical protein
MDAPGPLHDAGITIDLSYQFSCLKSHSKIPPHLPLPAFGREKIPKGGETHPPFDKGGWRGIRRPFSKR